MNRLCLMALAAALALFTAGAASAAPKAAKAEKKAASSGKTAIMECCAKGGCANCEVGNTAFFTEHACTQCAAGVADVAKHSHGDEHTVLSHGNAAFFTATACSAKDEKTVVKAAAESKPAAKPAKKK